MVDIKDVMNINNVKELLDRLEEYRNERDLSKERMARRLDVSLTTYMNWTNKSTEPDGENVLRILHILKGNGRDVIGGRR